MSIREIGNNDDPELDELVGALYEAHEKGLLRCLVVAWNARREDDGAPWQVSYAGFGDRVEDGDQAIAQLERAKFALLQDSMEDIE